MKVWTVFTKEMELTDVDVTFVLLYAEVEKESLTERKKTDFQSILDEAMMYLHNTSIENDMDYDEIQDWWFDEHKDVVKNLCF